MTDRPWTIAHRGVQAERLKSGAVRLHPENTLAALKRAAELDADAVELDVIAVKDARGASRLVVHHDDAWGRAFEQPGRQKLVKKTPFEEARGAKYRPDGLREAADGKLRDEADVRREYGDSQALPTLDEVVEAVLAIKPEMRFFIEMKTTGWKTPTRTNGMERALVAFIRARGLGDQAMAIGFNPWSVRRVKKLAPEIQTGLDVAPELVGFFGEKQLSRLMRFIKNRVKADAILPTYRQASESLMSAAREAGLKVMPWVGPETLKQERGEYARLQGLGVDGIVTNAAGELRKFLQEG